jgi:hypothetical protein
MRLSRLLSPFTLLNIALAVSGCAEDLKTKDDGDASSVQTVESESKGDGLHETVVNATDMMVYRYFDLDADAEVDEGSADWDLGFLRFKIKSNGGDSGDGGVLVAKLAGEDFDALSKAPDSGYVEDSDAVSSKSENGDPNYGFLGAEPWYDYGDKHQLSPKDVVYVVRSTAEKFYKVAVLNYYDKAGTSGYLTFKWAEIEAPDGPVMAGESKPDEEEEPSAPMNEGGGVAGCYDMKVHVCSCDSDEAACTEAMGIWTEQCNCGAEE